MPEFYSIQIRVVLKKSSLTTPNHARPATSHGGNNRVEMYLVAAYAIYPLFPSSTERRPVSASFRQKQTS